LVGAAFAVVAAAIPLGGASPIALLVGPIFAFILGLVVALPVYLFLERIGQLRPWWTAVLGSALMFIVARQVFPISGKAEYEYLFMRPGFGGELVPDWGVIGYASVGAVGGVIGWIAAFGFRMRPPSMPPVSGTGSSPA
jgi:hypothetical protein